MALYLVKNGRLPSFFGLFDVCGRPSVGGDGTDRLRRAAGGLLRVFFVVTVATVWAAWKVRKGSSCTRTRRFLREYEKGSPKFSGAYSDLLTFPWVISGREVRD
jgi:hypothetical protein